MNVTDQVIDNLAKRMADEIDDDIMETLVWQMNIEKNPDWKVVQIKWTKEQDPSYMWSEACAWAMEQFGLPGENYITHMSTDCINFLFRYEKDAILMTLKWI